MRRTTWSYYCPKCKEGFGDLEGEIIKQKYDGFGDRNRLIICPRGCGAWLVQGAYMSIDEFNVEDLEWWVSTMNRWNAVNRLDTYHDT